MNKQDKYEDSQVDSSMILGLPIDNLSTEETIEKILSMIDQFKIDQKPRLVGSVNVDNLVMTHSWLPGFPPRHPEMLEILRSADLLNADGMPLVWLSKLLGAPLKERVAGADLVPALCEAAVRRNARVFLLGGQQAVTNKAAEKLVQDNPGLEICGIATPLVNIAGENIDDEKNDLALVDEINQAKPDLLFIGFGNPKQLIWFQRNRDRLKVPVSIGVGGTFDFIAGNVKRAPLWMQKNGLEWIYRFTQDPKRLWKRYVVGLAKFAAMALPLMINHSLNRFLNPHKDKLAKTDETGRQLTTLDSKNVESFIHEGERYRVISLPQNIDRNWYVANSIFLQFHINQSGPLLFDFSDVEQMELSMMAFFSNLLNTDNEKRIHCINIDHPALIRSLKLNRVYDLFERHVFSSTPELLEAQSRQQIFSNFYYLLNFEDNVSVIRLFGRLDFAEMRKIDFEQIFASTLGQATVLDLTDLEFVDSSGLVFFIKFKKYFDETNQPLSLSNLNPVTQQVFKITRLNKLFDIETDKVKSIAKLRLANA
jgi:exopolysaccharide biosynthesis WecB/TagA/CpsF family protein/anti-anti-sigma factor